MRATGKERKGNKMDSIQAWTASKENAPDWWKKEMRGWKRTKESPKKTDFGISECWEKRWNGSEMKEDNRDWKQYRQRVKKKNKTGWMDVMETRELLSSDNRYTYYIEIGHNDKAIQHRHMKTSQGSEYEICSPQSVFLIVFENRSNRFSSHNHENNSRVKFQQWDPLRC